MHNHFPQPSDWSVFLGNTLGRGLVYAGLVFFILSAVSWFGAKANKRWEKLGSWAFTLGNVSLFGAFAVLATLFIGDHFEYVYVYDHSDKLNTLQYQISAIWSGQQGSFMLWAVCSAIFGLLTVRGTGPYRRWYTIIYSLFLMGLCGIMSYESAFNLHDKLEGAYILPPDGNGLAPSLLNYWITIHPPTIFLGFGSLTVLFAYATAALIEKNPLDWVPRVRPWTIISLTFIGVGLCMGGFWAYETLNWGGFWKWDPVENTSFVPWLFVAILIHGFLVQQARKKWLVSNMVLAGLPFISFIYGTFLTRSGFLGDTSVHSFAEMDNKALYLLMGMGGLFIVGFAALAIWRGPQIKREFPEADRIEPTSINREKLYLLGNYVLAFFAIAVAVGMSVPLIQAIAHKEQKVVEEGLYHNVIVWPFVPVMLLMAIAPFVSWRGAKPKELGNRLYLVLCVTIFLTGLALVAMKMATGHIVADWDQKISLLGWQVNATVWTMLLAGLCIFVIVSHSWKALELYRKNRPSVASFMSHVGLGVTLAGLIISRGMETMAKVYVQEGRPGNGLGYTVNLVDTGDPTNRENKVTFDVFNDSEKFTAKPGFYEREVKRTDETTGQPMDVKEPFVWPYIKRGLLHDIYFTMFPSFTEASDVMSFKEGETKKLGPSYEITYNGLKMEGNPGQQGTKFIANITLRAIPDDSGQAIAEDGKPFTVQPSLEIAEGGLQHNEAPVDDMIKVSLERIEVATKSADIQFKFYAPVYEIHMFYKPFVGFVWLGTGIMALAGFFAALNRRSRPATAAAESTKEEEDTESESDALKSLA